MGVDEGDYEVVGYAEYDARSTEPAIIAVTTRYRVYLTLVLKGVV